MKRVAETSRLNSSARLGRRPAAPAAAAGESLQYLALGLAAGVGVSSLVAGSAASLGAYFARQVVTPARQRVPDTEILAVIESAGGGRQIVLGATPETVVPGRYGLWFAEGKAFAEIGEIVEHEPGQSHVTRQLGAVHGGDIAAAVNGTWTGTQYPGPESLRLPYEEIDVPVEGGAAPAWLIPAEPGEDTEGERITAILVHGRGATRAECLRAVPVLHSMGITCLVISYRNDGDAPAALDGRYGLGGTEWHDVDAAILQAKALGAEGIVLVGFSMGGAIALQTNDRSVNAKDIRALVLDGPVVDWVDVLAHQARVHRLPSHVSRFGLWLLTNKAGRRMTGLAAPLDLKGMDWVSRADQLRTPTLVIHSADDDFVPYGPSAALAEKNPEIVTLERFTTARHTKEYNVDPERWEKAVSTWLTRTLQARRPPAFYRR
ncbi:alpha/beta hydrolase [Falsarthrobacter nasiphocae]|uniref:Alpha-beta hydrolase superfamily lysophospholipase n=1 Tax=Falsarthrobacter nasiphocae TaxID=189863 RepID=A0AAE4C589_9MICC|nr:alpha/beta fold hydrolase [Falsarthrobacter nasiphocae]MDR6891248.1 alpha-beta hydrolase superfamily lysophospholipase [Falsarthrobacter nasiphocae]